MDWVNNPVKKLSELAKEEPVKKIGDGDMRREQACKNFKVFMACRGLVSEERKIVVLGPASTLQDARDAFGRPMRQEIMCDANGYQLTPSDKLWMHSKDCNVSLVFKDDILNDTGKGIGHLNSGFKGVVDHVQNIGRS